MAEETSRVVLRQHAVVLLPEVLLSGLVAGGLAGVAVLFADALLPALAGAGVAGVRLAWRVRDWWLSHIAIGNGRVTTYALCGLRARSTSYTLASCWRIELDQSPLAALADAGTLTLILPDRTVRYRWLTPFSALTCALET